MSLLSLQAWKDKWAAITGRFADNDEFEIGEDDFREFALDIADTVIAKMGAGQGVVTSYASLLTTYTAADNLQNGFFVSVWDNEVARRGIYFLINKNSLSSPSSWLRISGTSVLQPQNPSENFYWSVMPKVEIVNGYYRITQAGTAVYLGGTIPFGISNIAPVVSPEAGKFRIDFLAAYEDGVIEVYKGSESATQPGTPQILNGGLYITMFILNSEGVPVEGGANPDIELLQAQINYLHSVSQSLNLAIALKANNSQTANLWSWIGLATSSTTITVKGWLDLLSSKVKANEENLALKMERGAVVAFNATGTFNTNKIMKLGGSDTGAVAFTADHQLNNPASGNVPDTFRTVIVIGNGTNTITFHSSWKNANKGKFNVLAGAKNEIIMRYLDENNKTYTITQPV